MARPEQVLVLEPQHELKFRGNAGAEGRAGDGMGGGARQLTQKPSMISQCVDSCDKHLKVFVNASLFVVTLDARGCPRCV